MPARKPRPSDGKTQAERFIETARELGCDEDLEAFKEKLAEIARHRPPPDDGQTAPSKGSSKRRAY